MGRMVKMCTLLLFSRLSQLRAEPIELGQMAPDFELQDQQGKFQGLMAYRGKWVVLYFYPKDDTPGCTREACQFRDDIFKLRSLNVQVLGVSLDSTKSHAEFAEKFSLPFPLLADVNGSVAESYGALSTLGPLKWAKRHTIIVDPEGKIAKIFRSVRPRTHSDEIIVTIQTLQTRNR